MIAPKSEAELSQAIAEAEGPLAISGGGTRSLGVPVAGETLCTAGLSGITLYEPGALTLVARAGTPLAEVESTLAGENQRLAFEPMDHRPLLGREGTPTIGGVVAANVAGPRRIQAGACRDSLIGVRFADGRGKIIKNGGRVMKNVTGYDLVKLLAGSYGTLGVLSEVSFKVLPASETVATLSLEGLDTARAVRALSLALGSPFEVTGAAHAPQGFAPSAGGPARGPLTLLRIEGFAESVRYRSEKLRRLLAEFGEPGLETDVGANAGLWADVRDLRAFAGSDSDVWRISVKPTDAPAAAARLDAERTIFDWGGGLIWAEVEPGRDIRPVLAGIAGHATLIRAAEDTRRRIPVFQPEPAAVETLAAGLRRQFDPRGILNPGLMG